MHYTEADPVLSGLKLIHFEEKALSFFKHKMMNTNC